MTDQFQEPSFPTVLDNTMVKLFKKCPQAFFRSYIERIKPKGKSEHLIAGSAYARGLEVARLAIYRDGEETDEALVQAFRAAAKEYGDYEPPERSAKTFLNVGYALIQYFRDFPVEFDRIKPWFHHGEPAVEFSFAEPLMINHPVTGDPLLYGGKFDMLADMNGLPFVYDDKTTGAISEKWREQWQLASQFIGYTWGAQRNGYPIAGTIVRGMSLQKTQNKTLEVPLYHPQFLVERWYDQLHRDIQRMIQCWESWYFDYNLGDACTDYGGCPFTPLCTTDDPESWKSTHYEHNPWTPVQDEVI